ncbi:2123_t:CDS:2 [Paraglomus brasilianum]|uniref:2123_t:CDS:1 n=1 Tax=Paraglomus brasilianum TaxID=144538 RepID=A0A9N9FYY8_9GLOM|nr:2123_t:CDS:2 [Paraglomus brasilianum]
MLSSKLQALRLAALLLLYQLVSTVFAAPPSPSPIDITPSTVLAWIVLQNAEPSDGYGGSQGASDAIYLVVSIVVGLVFGALALCFSTLVVWVLGGLAGYAIALFILSFGTGGLIHDRAGRIIFIIAFIIAGVILTILFTNMAIIIGTAFIGAFSIILGIDMFARTGFAETFSSMQNVNKDTLEYHVGGRVLGMLIGMIVLFMVGVVVQWHFFRAYKFGYYDPATKSRFGRWRWRTRNRPVV